VESLGLLKALEVHRALELHQEWELEPLLMVRPHMALLLTTLEAGGEGLDVAGGQRRNWRAASATGRDISGGIAWISRGCKPYMAQCKLQVQARLRGGALELLSNKPAGGMLANPEEALPCQPHMLLDLCPLSSHARISSQAGISHHHLLQVLVSLCSFR
jgi:hypothetical protein